MGFFQDLKQDLSQSANDLGVEDTMVDLNMNAEGVSDPGDLFGGVTDTGFSDFETMIKKDAAALEDELAAGALPQTENETAAELSFDDSINVGEGQIQNDAITTAAPMMASNMELVNSGIEQPMQEVEATNISEPQQMDMQPEQPTNEAVQNISEPASASEASVPQPETEPNAADSKDTAVITKGMTITGDVTCSGNMNLIGNINGNIDISGKLNVTGSITGNSSAAEIYAESAQINGEIKSKGTVKVGQSSVVIGNIFASSAVIAGAVKGDIDVHGPVILDVSAIVMGNIKSKSVQINNGAVIEGLCSQCYADIRPSSFFDDVKKNRK